MTTLVTLSLLSEYVREPIVAIDSKSKLIEPNDSSRPIDVFFHPNKANFVFGYLFCLYGDFVSGLLAKIKRVATILFLGFCMLFVSHSFLFLMYT